MEREYALNTATDLGRRQLDHLQELLDPYSQECLSRAGVRPGLRCLDIGAGGGSITRWLADRVGPDGKVVAVDLDTDWLDDLRDHPCVEVYRHDINEGPPVDGPFDIIHVRLVLMHLSRRREILKGLAATLAPGGALVVGEYTGVPQRALAAPSADDELLFQRVQELAHAHCEREYGISYHWAHELDDAMVEAGLVDPQTIQYSSTATGGGTGCLLNLNYVQQLEAALLARSGLTRAELDRYFELMLDPRFQTRFYTFFCSTARRPMHTERR
jgi:ubiquinone/menaquinone biosynthesis C-methylase UbiE